MLALKIYFCIKLKSYSSIPTAAKVVSTASGGHPVSAVTATAAAAVCHHHHHHTQGHQQQSQATTTSAAISTHERNTTTTLTNGNNETNVGGCRSVVIFVLNGKIEYILSFSQFLWRKI